MSLSRPCGGILTHSYLHNCFNSATLEGFRAWMDSLRSCHSISIGFKTLIWPLQNLNFVFLSHSEVNMLVCWGSLSCCITQVRLSLRSQTDGRTFSFSIYDRVQNSWFHQLWQVVQVLKLQNSIRPSHYHHHVWLLIWCYFYEILCWIYARCNGTHTFQNGQKPFPGTVYTAVKFLVVQNNTNADFVFRPNFTILKGKKKSQIKRKLCTLLYFLNLLNCIFVITDV